MKSNMLFEYQSNENREFHYLGGGGGGDTPGIVLPYVGTKTNA